MEGASNKTIVNLFAEKTSSEVKKNFVAIFPSNYEIKFISLHCMMTESGAVYPFILINTGHSGKKGGISFIYIQKRGLSVR